MDKLKYIVVPSKSTDPRWYSYLEDALYWVRVNDPHATLAIVLDLEAMALKRTSRRKPLRAPGASG